MRSNKRCRNILIHGSCKYEKTGCEYNHDPAQPFVPQLDAEPFVPNPQPFVPLKNSQPFVPQKNSKPFTPQRYLNDTKPFTPMNTVFTIKIEPTLERKLRLSAIGSKLSRVHSI
jgi:hypothetical protein